MSIHDNFARPKESPDDANFLDKADVLSAREKQVLELMAAGLTNDVGFW